MAPPKGQLLQMSPDNVICSKLALNLHILDAFDVIQTIHHDCKKYPYDHYVVCGIFQL